MRLPNFCSVKYVTKFSLLGETTVVVPRPFFAVSAYLPHAIDSDRCGGSGRSLLPVLFRRGNKSAG